MTRISKLLLPFYHNNNYYNHHNHTRRLSAKVLVVLLIGSVINSIMSSSSSSISRVSFLVVHASKRRKYYQGTGPCSAWMISNHGGGAFFPLTNTASSSIRRVHSSTVLLYNMRNDKDRIPFGVPIKRTLPPPLLESQVEEEEFFGGYYYDDQPDPYDMEQINNEPFYYTTEQQPEEQSQQLQHPKSQPQKPQPQSRPNQPQLQAKQKLQPSRPEATTKTSQRDTTEKKNKTYLDNNKQSEDTKVLRVPNTSTTWTFKREEFFQVMDQYDTGTRRRMPTEQQQQQQSNNYELEAMKHKLQFLEEQIYECNNNQQFNIKSPKQVSVALFGVTNQSTNKEVLDGMASAGNHMADLILQHRKLSRDIKKQQSKHENKKKGLYVRTVSNVVKTKTNKEQSEQDSNDQETLNQEETKSNTRTNTDINENKKNDNDPLLLVDGSAYIFRAYYSMPPLHRRDGTPVGAVLGFCNMLNRLVLDQVLKGKRPSIVIVFDTPGCPTFRKLMYDQYKANRSEAPMDLIPQFTFIRKACKAYGIVQIEAETYEADDVIATLANQALIQGIDVNILSGDKDLMQLITPSDNVPSVIQMIDPMHMKRVTHEEVIEKWGVPPHQLADLLALAGDKSDNIPGVPGIGPKIAAKLLQEFQTLDNLLQNIPKVKRKSAKEKLLQHSEDAKLSKRLVSLVDNVPPQEITVTKGGEEGVDNEEIESDDNDNNTILNNLGDLRIEEIGDGQRLLNFYSQMGLGDIKRRVEYRLRQSAQMRSSLSSQQLSSSSSSSSLSSARTNTNNIMDYSSSISSNERKVGEINENSLRQLHQEEEQEEESAARKPPPATAPSPPMIPRKRYYNKKKQKAEIPKPEDYKDVPF